MEYPVYLDNAATTAVDPAVVEAMLPYFLSAYGNPATLYSVGMMAREAVDHAREVVADMINASPDEIVFTSGGTEADNAAIKGIASAYQEKGKHLITSAIEHHAVLEPMETLAHSGYQLDILPIDSDGRVSPGYLKHHLRPDTILASIMHANNEIGTIQPIGEIGAICRQNGTLFHTDAVQTFGKIPIDVREQKIDLLSVSAHKLHGPKGIGFLYVRRGTKANRFMEGGGQERGYRSGTLNVPGIVGLGKATELARERMESEGKRLTTLRDVFIAKLVNTIPGVTVNGSRTHRLPNNISICIEGVQGEVTLLALDAARICASAGSACSTGSMEPSHVLKALGVSRDLARGAVRLTLGRETTMESLDYTLDVLEQSVQGLRQLAGA